MTLFSAEVDQNEYLPLGGTEVHAIVTVTATDGPGATASAAEAVEIVIIDVSGSMGTPRNKLRSAKEATRAAIDCIRDGVRFAVLAGDDEATAVYPKSGTAIADPSARRSAREAVERLKDGGGTQIGRWLTLANELFGSAPGTIRHAILLTDGQNGERPGELEDVLARCAGRFQCDCRGVGTDWEVDELRKISTALLGTVDIVPEPEGLESEFRTLIEEAMGKATADVVLRLWTPQGAKVAYVKQVAPTVEDLTDRAIEARKADGDPIPLTVDFPTGAWGEEWREYHVCIEVPARELGDETLAGRFKLMVDDEVASEAKILAIWTDDEVLSTRINLAVAHYNGQAELAEAIQEGLQARRDGDERRATSKLGRAVQLAAESGNEGTMKLLARVVDIDDPVRGTVRLRRNVAEVDEMSLDTRSTKTVRVQRSVPPTAPEP
jgi:hypothetical protein